MIVDEIMRLPVATVLGPSPSPGSDINPTYRGTGGDASGIIYAKRNSKRGGS